MHLEVLNRLLSVLLHLPKPTVTCRVVNARGGYPTNAWQSPAEPLRHLAGLQAAESLQGVYGLSARRAVAQATI